MLLMMAALCWLTVSVPFVYSAQTAALKSGVQSGSSETEKDSAPNPFANTTEEKTESGVNVFSEYLHETDVQVNYVASSLAFHKCHSSDLYYAFHPDLLLPPPKV